MHDPSPGALRDDVGDSFEEREDEYNADSPDYENEQLYQAMGPGGPNDLAALQHHVPPES